MTYLCHYALMFGQKQASRPDLKTFSANLSQFIVSTARNLILRRLAAKLGGCRLLTALLGTDPLRFGDVKMDEQFARWMVQLQQTAIHAHRRGVDSTELAGVPENAGRVVVARTEGDFAYSTGQLSESTRASRCRDDYQPIDQQLINQNAVHEPPE
jgi:hypothetical protein